MVHSMNYEATMPGTRKVRVLQLSSWGTFMVLKVGINMCRLHPDITSYYSSHHTGYYKPSALREDNYAEPLWKI
jgi:hypothetical protein